MGGQTCFFILAERNVMTKEQKKWLVIIAILMLLAALGAGIREIFTTKDRDNGLASGNGRIEAVEIDIAAKSAGRVKDILIREGQMPKKSRQT